MVRKQTLSACLIAAAAVALSAAAVFSAPTKLGDADRGRELAVRLCAGCHVVAPDAGATVNADIPSFAAIAAMPGMNEERMAGRIVVPHPPMPDAQLTVTELRDVIVYIQSLKLGR